MIKQYKITNSRTNTQQVYEEPVEEATNTSQDPVDFWNAMQEKEDKERKRKKVRKRKKEEISKQKKDIEQINECWNELGLQNPGINRLFLRTRFDELIVQLRELRKLFEEKIIEEIKYTALRKQVRKYNKYVADEERVIDIFRVLLTYMWQKTDNVSKIQNYYEGINSAIDMFEKIGLPIPSNQKIEINDFGRFEHGDLIECKPEYKQNYPYLLD